MKSILNSKQLNQSIPI